MQLLRLLVLHLDLLDVFARLVFVLQLGIFSDLTTRHNHILTIDICAVNLLAELGRVTLALLNVMILLTVEDVEVLLGLVVGSGATRARHVCLVPDASANDIEVRLPLLLVSQLTVRLVSALEVVLVTEASARAGCVQSAGALHIFYIFLRRVHRQHLQLTLRMVDRLLLVLTSDDTAADGLLRLAHHVLLMLVLLLHAVNHARIDVMFLGLRVHTL